MSSSSSSDCECDDYCHYASSFYENYGNTNNRTPYCPTMGHPLIYYTQTSPYYQPQPVNRRQSRKRNPNCFVKAFRWYTQERVSKRNEPRPESNETEFASWLDMKYDEFIGKNSDQQNSYKVTLKQTSVIKAEKKFQNVCADTCTNNKFKTKFKRLRSPWGKKCRARDNKETCDIDKGTQSCQYILQPKELSRPNSEFCHSSIITVSTEHWKKTAGKSQSLTNLCQERITNEPIEVIPTQEGVQLNRESSYKKDSPINKKSDSRMKSVLAHVYCQCSVGIINKSDAETQYEDVPVDNTLAPCCFKQALPTKSNQAQKVTSKATLPLKTRTVSCECGRNDVICECVDKVPAMKTPSIDVATQYEPPKCEGISNNVLYQAVPVPKPPPRKCPCEMEPEEFIVPVAPLKLSNIGAQTSDRCITFTKGSPYNYPLFMKIICADKLIDENST